jgi:hypothetical protein
MSYVVETVDCSLPPQQRASRNIGQYATLRAATFVAEQAIAASLSKLYEPGVTAVRLFACWNADGKSARIVGASFAEFDAYTYAKSRCEEMCQPTGTTADRFLGMKLPNR